MRRLALKERRYRQQGIDANVTFIPGNYVTDGLIDLLLENGFDLERRTYLIWEGNTMYLPLNTMRHVLEELRTYLKRFRLSFDYMAEAVISGTTGDPGIARLVESFARMGAPWLSGIKDVRSLASDLGLRLFENLKTAELHKAYRPGRQMTSRIFEFYSVCTVGF